MKDRIKQIRKEKGYNQTQFGEKIGVTQSAVTGWESGTRIPTGSALNAICRVFDINEEWLYTGKGEMKTKKTENQEIAEFLTETMECDDTFKKRFIAALSHLNEDEWKLLAKIAEEMTKEN